MLPRPAAALAAAVLKGAAALAAVPVGFTGAAGAAELVMFESKVCPWCLKWRREIGPIYGLTDEGRLLPLRSAAFPADVPADLTLAEPVRYMPTFVAIECGREVGRVVGYNGDEQFWGELSVIAKRVTGECPRED